jgi:hypothetical protein
MGGENAPLRSRYRGISDVSPTQVRRECNFLWAGATSAQMMIGTVPPSALQAAPVT